MDESALPIPDDETDDVEAHGLKEGLAVALGVGALAAPAAQAYVPNVGADGTETRIAVTTTHSVKAKAKKTKKAKSAAATHVAIKKPPLQPEG
ncbi:MAG TPA: hypothetical protein VFR43_13460 [Gaiellaceae bacterium]|nr:hypothetical protein [Gaiellaceae bacterium]